MALSVWRPNKELSTPDEAVGVLSAPHFRPLAFLGAKRALRREDIRKLERERGAAGLAASAAGDERGWREDDDGWRATWSNAKP